MLLLLFRAGSPVGGEESSSGVRRLQQAGLSDDGRFPVVWQSVFTGYRRDAILAAREAQEKLDQRLKIEPEQESDEVLELVRDTEEIIASAQASLEGESEGARKTSDDIAKRLNRLTRSLRAVVESEARIDERVEQAHRQAVRLRRLLMDEEEAIIVLMAAV